jgi:rubrerythrin
VPSSTEHEHRSEPGSREDSGSRRGFLHLSGAGAAGALAVLLAACGGDDEGAPKARPADGDARPACDVDIVNYALTLEYIEADFYDQAIRSGEITDRKVADLAKRIGEHEQEHVEALSATVKKLGGRAARKPWTDFDTVLAGGATEILQTAATVENLGAAAYLGQAARIQSKEVLAAALSIHTVEARHAAALNKLVGRDFRAGSPLEGSLPDGAFAAPMAMAQVLEQVKPFLAS